MIPRLIGHLRKIIGEKKKIKRLFDEADIYKN